MSTYFVTYPIAGQVTVRVEADSEHAAIEAGWDEVSEPSAELEWEAMEQIVQGNIFCGSTNSISVVEDDDDDD